MNTQSWILLVIALGVNLAAGGLVALLKIPIYLDSLGTVLAGALVGPAFGALTGAFGTLVLALSGPTVLAFLPVAVLVGVSAGWAGRQGALTPTWALVWGGITGVFTATLAAPIATAIFGGVTGGGTDLLVAVFRASGRSALEAAWLQAMAVDPLDKAIVFGLVFGLLRVLPPRSLTSFPNGRATWSRRGDSLRTGREAYTYRPQLERSPTPNDPQRLWPEKTQAKQLPGSGLLGDMDPVVKGGIFGLTALSLVLGKAVSITWAAWALWLLLVAICGGRSARRAVAEGLILLLPLAVSVLVIHGLFTPTEAGSIEVFGLKLSLQGLELSELLIRRLAILVVLALVYFRTTAVDRLQESLLRIGCPYPLIFTLLSSVALGPELLRRYRAVRLAQESRGLSPKARGPVALIRRFWSTFVPTLGALFSELPRRAASLQSRGFRSSGWRSATEDRPPETGEVRAFQAALSLFALLLAFWAAWSLWS